MEGLRYRLQNTKTSLLVIFFFAILNPIFGAGVGQIISEKRYEMQDAQEKRIYEDVVIDCGEYGHANFTISLPDKIPEEGLPCILIVGGLMTGRESLEFVPDHGQYALVAYEYTDTLKNLHKVNVIWHIFSVRKAAIEVAPQVTGIVKYLKKQRWLNKEPISLMGYSFGAVFMPVTYVHAQNESVSLGPGVLAYGGAGAYCLFEANLPGPKWVRRPIASLAAALFRPIDPIVYAPEMQGEFLIINGIYDSQIPMPCAKKLQNLVPEPKTIINLETEHMHPDNTELTLRLIKISRQWLEEKRNDKR